MRFRLQYDDDDDDDDGDDDDDDGDGDDDDDDNIYPELRISHAHQLVELLNTDHDMKIKYTVDNSNVLW